MYARYSKGHVTYATQLFFRFFFAGFRRIATMHLCTKFYVSISTRFADRLGCTPKFMRVT